MIKSTTLPNFRGPHGEKTIVVIGWHIDGEAAVVGANPETKDHVAALSEGAYGVSTGVPRILQLHSDLQIPASFFVPGYVAEQHPAETEAIAKAGHEIGHHGYMHENCFLLDDDQQREVFAKGTAALKNITGKDPIGWSAPSWGVKESTLNIMMEMGMRYDNSLMEYDVPYLIETEVGQLVELPISMILDDWEILGANLWPGGGVNATAHSAYTIWKEEFDAMRRFGGLFCTTFHPNLMARPGRMAMLYELFGYMQSFSDVWWTTCEGAAEYVWNYVETNQNDATTTTH